MASEEESTRPPTKRERWGSGEYKLLPERLRALVEKAGPDSPFAALAGESLARMPVRPEATPPVEGRPLTIGMSTYDDFDGVYFTIQAIRTFHPEVTDQTEILIIDNHPEGPEARPLQELARAVPGCRYVPYDRFRGTAVRDLVFREASGEFVLCVDSHVLFPPGTLRRLLDYLLAHPDSQDLLQGPLLDENLQVHATHFDRTWSEGMYGQWGLDPRGLDPDGEPFDIESQGLGVFACRRAVWPGLNPRLHGFGGEEGYLHEKVRRHGGRTLCLPFLRWLHRFGRPAGTGYRNTWEDRLRNYLVIADELGWEEEVVLDHFRGVLGPEPAGRIAARVRRELAGPFHYFDAIYCINLDAQPGRWASISAQCDALGFGHRLRRLAGVETPRDSNIGCTLSHRRAVEEARRDGLRQVLVLEDDAVFHEATLPLLTRAIEELGEHEWSLLFLGGHVWGETPRHLPGCRVLARPSTLTASPATVYHERIYDEMLADLPADEAGMERWCETEFAVDQYLSRHYLDRALVSWPLLASQPNLWDAVEPGWRDGFHGMVPEHVNGSASEVQQS